MNKHRLDGISVTWYNRTNIELKYNLLTFDTCPCGGIIVLI